jgi:hypothetical protein
MVWRVDFGQYQRDPRFNAVFNRMPVRPNWVLLTAVAVGAFVVVVPLVLLAIAGLVVGLVTFAVLALVAQAVAAVRSLFGGGTSGDRGRRNVRVIDPNDRV